MGDENNDNLNQYLKARDVALEFGLTNKQIDEITEIFNRYDVHKKGKIVVQDIKEAFSKIEDSPSEEGLTELLKSADRNGDGAVELWEFMYQIASKLSKKHRILKEQAGPINKRNRTSEDIEEDGDREDLSFKIDDIKIELEKSPEATV